MSYNIILYSRLSNEDDNINDTKQESNSISNQKKLLEDFVKSKEEFVNANIIEKFDDGYSGVNLERPAIKEVLEMFEKREVNCIIIKDLSRFLRNDLETIYYLDEVFPLYDVRLISIGDKYDSNDYIGQGSNVNIVFRSIANRMYSEDLSKKTKQGLKQKALNGKFISAIPPFGYKKSHENKHQLIIDDEAAKIVRYIFKLALKDKSTNEIACVLNEDKIPTCSQVRNRSWNTLKYDNKWNYGKVRSILEDESYIGSIVYGKVRVARLGERKVINNTKEDFIIYKNAHEPIISKENFDEVQKKLVKNKIDSNKKTMVYLFSKKLRCENCGRLLARKTTKSNVISYRCLTPYCDKNCNCFTGKILESVIVEFVLKALEKQLIKSINVNDINTKLEYLVATIKNQKKTILSKEKSLTNILDKGMIAYDKYKDNLIDKAEYLLIKQGLNSQKEDLTNELGTLKLSSIELSQEYELLSQNKNYKLDELFKTEKLTREVVEQFIDCIYVNNDLSIDIHFN